MDIDDSMYTLLLYVYVIFIKYLQYSGIQLLRALLLTVLGSNTSPEALK